LPDDSALSTPQSALDLETPFDLADPLAPPVTLDLPLDAKIPQTYIETEALRLQMYRRIAGITHVESIDEMRQELIDRFGKDEDTQSVPEEVENLLFQIRVKILALRAGVNRIGRELDQLVLHSEALENMNRPAMQRRLRQGLGQLDDANINPDEAARVARRAIYLPIDETGYWRTALVRTLEIMAYG
jgi:transcription-repair coupling factor (superfamily II helicase)